MATPHGSGAPTPGVRMRVAVLAFAGLAGTAAAATFLDRPAAWIFTYWAVLSGALFVTLSARVRWIFYNAVFVFLVFGATEFWFGRDATESRFETERTPGIRDRPDSLMGRAPLPNLVQRMKRYRVNDDGTEEPVFDVEYTLGANGLRVTPPVEGTPEACVLFFGGSFTFGIGVADHEVTAFLVSSESRGRVRTHNFAVGGGGPHNMLAALQSGFVDRSVDCIPTHAVYLMIPGHVSRVARLRAWTANHPAYGLIGGELRFLGVTEDAYPLRQRVTRKLRAVLRSSEVFTRLGPSQIVTDGDHVLTAAVILESVDELTSRYPGLEFDLLAWDADTVDFGDLERVLDLLGDSVDVHVLTTIIPDIENGLYRLGDGHPAPLAHQRLAEYVLGELIGLPESDPERSDADPSRTGPGEQR
jgi:hypothetical protein